MVFKVFLDANILLDLLLMRSKYDVAKQIMLLAVAGNVQVFTTPAIIHIVAYWTTKTYGKQRTKELILLLLADLKVIDADHEVTVNAVNSKIDDIEDALQYFTAMHHRLDYFLTSDKILLKSAFPTLPAYTVEYFLTDIYHK